MDGHSGCRKHYRSSVKVAVSLGLQYDGTFGSTRHQHVLLSNEAIIQALRSMNKEPDPKGRIAPVTVVVPIINVVDVDGIFGRRPYFRGFVSTILLERPGEVAEVEYLGQEQSLRWHNSSHPVYCEQS